MATDDKRLRDDLRRELEWDPRVEAAHIGVAVNNGVVTLTGYVASYPEKVAAEEAVRRVRGVRGFAQEIAVRLPDGAKASDEELAARVVRALEWDEMVPRDRISVVAEHGIIHLEGVVSRAFERDEAELDVRKIRGVNGVVNGILVEPESGVPSAEAIRRALERSNELDARHVAVEVSGNDVILRGHVQRWREREVAERIAWCAGRVRRVDNAITVAAKK